MVGLSVPADTSVVGAVGDHTSDETGCVCPSRVIKGRLGLGVGVVGLLAAGVLGRKVVVAQVPRPPAASTAAPPTINILRRVTTPFDSATTCNLLALGPLEPVEILNCGSVITVGARPGAGIVGIGPELEAWVASNLSGNVPLNACRNSSTKAWAEDGRWCGFFASPCNRTCSTSSERSGLI